MLVLAGAGSGKTRVITHRIAWGLASGAFTPEQVLAVTFTNKAAGEMRTRISTLTGRDFSSLWIRTFHSACAAILRLEAARLDYPRGFSIYDAADQLAVVKRILKTHLTLGEAIPPRPLSTPSPGPKTICNCRVTLIPMTDQSFHQRLHTVYGNTIGSWPRPGLLISETSSAGPSGCTKRTRLLEKWRRIFPFLLVDEFQDSNRAQYRLVRLLAGEARNICVVGDDDHPSTPAGRGHRHILSFKDDFPAADCASCETTAPPADPGDRERRHQVQQRPDGKKRSGAARPAGERCCSAFADDREEARGRRIRRGDAA
jgi:DNA helicase-2/ATP-dependent DNA helicase PcrA